MGMAHVPEGRRVFAQLSVLQNLMMGAYTRKDKEEIAQTLETVFDRFPRLKERQNQTAGTLSGGEQQMLCHLYSFLIQILEVAHLLKQMSAYLVTVNQFLFQMLMHVLVHSKGYVRYCASLC